jgi:uncharacterized membrane protein SpoIIM required for sporulation
MGHRLPGFTHRQHLEVETPEHVLLDYELAGVGSRVLAAVADWFLVSLAFLAVLLGGRLWRDAAPWLFAALGLLLYALLWGYFTCFEAFRRGQTPGKRWLGIRVLRDTGHPVTFGDAATRNLLLPVDLFCLVGVFVMAIHPRARRIGDIVAGTVVVRDHPVEVRAAGARPAPPPAGAGPPELDDEEFRLLRQFSHRAGSLPAPTRARLARTLAARFAERYPGRPAEDEVFLERLHQDEQSRRRGSYGARGTSREGVADRLAARKGGRWDAFQALVERAARSGLDSLSAEELPDFAARYREVSSDLARARTYGADRATLLRLERLVAAGHSALYRGERETWRRIGTFLVRECPAAIVAAHRTVALAALLFLLPGLAGYAVLRERPALAPLVLPAGMLERAEAGAGRQAAGAGYVQALRDQRPLLASGIIANNIRVSFTVFAGGIALGVGSLLLLAYNGLALGAVSGHFANAGLLGYLWTFVIGHGLLELFAIWVAGAAGFLLGKALVLPGRLSRRDALVLAAREEMRLLGAVVVLLLVAGAIEGFVSASTWPLWARLTVSGASLLFLLLYLWNGALWRRRGDLLRT